LVVSLVYHVQSGLKARIAMHPIAVCEEAHAGRIRVMRTIWTCFLNANNLDS